MKANAMLFAAGLGTRLKPLTEHTPKPLVKVGGRALIDYNLEHFARFGCERVVVNTHYLGQQIAEHLAQHWTKLPLQVMHEEQLLETGGGIVNALSALGDEPFFSANSDAFWCDGQTSALARMAASFDNDRMDALLLVVPLERAVGFSGRADFALSANGELQRSASAEYVFTGLQILHPRLFAGRQATPFSLREIYQAAQRSDGTLARLHGLIHDGAWVHVGNLEELESAERYLAQRSELRVYAER